MCVLHNMSPLKYNNNTITESSSLAKLTQKNPFQKVCAVFMHPGITVKISASSHLDMYGNTTPHHFHRYIVLTLGIQGEKRRGKATNTTKRSVSKMLSNGWKHCSGPTCGAIFNAKHWELVLDDCLTFHLNQTLGGYGSFGQTLHATKAIKLSNPIWINVFS